MRLLNSFSVLTLLVLLILPQVLKAQRVGIVLSGGGSSGLAHIGVLKALEDHNIPIDYITGTSMGALVGGMYASGYTIDEIIGMATSEKFQLIAEGGIEDDYVYTFRNNNNDASWATVRFTRDSIWHTFLPSSVINPVALDFEMMTYLSGPIAAAGYNFDSLYVPFRCVAADIEDKEVVVFRDGHLNQAVRASMSYPFYLKPIKVNGKLLFDGGLYNNFPSDVMYSDFFPDIIIGSNVSSNFDPPHEDDVLSQIKNMLVAKTDYDVICENGIIIEPKVESSTFNFSDAAEAIAIGYNETMKQIPAIQAAIDRRVTKEARTARRNRIRAQWPQLNFDQIHVDGLKKGASSYVSNILLRKKNRDTDLEMLKRAYFRVYGDDKIESLYPTATWYSDHDHYDLHLDVKRAKDLRLDVGGNFSSRPINTAYIGMQYNYLGRYAYTLTANSYFGKLYGSTQVKLRSDFPLRVPVFLEAEFTRNRWDYFRSRATFFEDVKPSFLIQNETVLGLNGGMAIKARSKLIGGIQSVDLKDEYYQTAAFTSVDTSDQTTFDATSVYAQFEHNTLNRKQYATKGSRFVATARYNYGTEVTRPGSTSQSEFDFFSFHEWLEFHVSYQNYYKKTGNLRLGVLAEGAYSTQQDFNNYTASLLRAPAFRPTPESQTLFLQSFRAYKYAGLGHQIVYSPVKNLDLRLEGYIFQPVRELLRAEDFTVDQGPNFDRRYTIAMAAAVYHTPLGPVSFSTNYYYNAPQVAQLGEVPITFLFHFGYILFNQSAMN